MKDEQRTSEAVDTASGVRDRLDGWKEIAVYFNQSVRVVKIWAAEHEMPVRALVHSIYASKRDLDVWKAEHDLPYPQFLQRRRAASTQVAA